MPEYLSPGVYVEEVPPAALPIAGVGTSTAGFIGVVGNGVVMPDRPVKPGDPITQYTVAPAGEAVLITSWTAFKNNFGDFQAGNARLAHAVYGFFNNGGTRCYVVRVAAAGDLTNLTQELDALAPIDEIAIVAVPGATDGVQHTAIIAHCFNLQDRFAILDGVQAPAALDELSIAAGVGRSEAGSYAAVYFPWLQVFDPITETIIEVPPSGHIAGIYARSDATRGVHKAPANEVVIGAVGLEMLLTKADQDGLNPDHINLIRSFNGSIKVWGARTRTDAANADFNYVSTRRFFNFMRESIDEGTQFVVFEPNSPALWQRIIRSVSDFLTNQYNAGALFGTTASKSFFVRCDETTNPPAVRDLGQVVTEIGVAIVRPAEFVIFRVQQISGS